MTPIGLWLLTAHLVGDFTLQPDWIANSKTESNTRLLIHVGVHFFLNIPIAWYLFPNDHVQQLILLGWIAGTHFVIDYRRWFEPKEEWGDNRMAWVWLNDQILHLISLSLSIPIVNFGPWA